MCTEKVTMDKSKPISAAICHVRSASPIWNTHTLEVVVDIMSSEPFLHEVSTT